MRRKAFLSILYILLGAISIIVLTLSSESFAADWESVIARQSGQVPIFRTKNFEMLNNGDAEAIFVGDIDDNGTDELLICSETTCAIYEYLETLRKKSWQFPISIGSQEVLALEDVNSDGCADLLAISADDRISIFDSNCQSGFSGDAKFPPHAQLGSGSFLAMGHFRKKSELEIVVASAEKSVLRILPLLSEGTPLEIPLPSNLTFEAKLAQIVDVDGDGLDDFLLPEKNRLSSTLYPGRLDFSWVGLRAVDKWQKHVSSGDEDIVWGVIPGSFPLLMVVAIDVDGDAKQDLVAFGRHSREIYLVKSFADFAVELSLIQKDEGAFDLQNVVAADLNGDGKKDLLARSGSAVRVFLNQIQGEFFSKPPGWQAEGGNVPQVCVGYHPSSRYRWGNNQRICPENYFIAGTRDWTNTQLEQLGGAFRSVCCPLPSQDIVTNEIVWSEGDCPPDHVISGVRTENGKAVGQEFVQCRKINSSRYKLGEPQAARQWGAGGSNAFVTTSLPTKGIPMAAFYAVSRWGFKYFLDDGCVPDDQNSLMTAHQGRRGCSGFTYRELQYRGLAQDPPSGTAVKLFPKCRSVKGIFSPYPECVQ